MKIKSYDIWLCLLYSAALHGNSSLSPFPSIFNDEKDNKNYSKLLKTIESMPSPSKILSQVTEKRFFEAKIFKNEENKNLFRYIDKNICENSFKRFEFLDEEKSKKVCWKYVKEATKHHKPDLVFRIKDKNDSHWRKLRGKGNESRKTVIGFHGSKLSNFYSIIRNGLQLTMSSEKRPLLFGRGVYFSKKLSVARDFSSRGRIWKGSNLGSKLACVIACEVIVDEEGVEEKEVEQEDDYLICKKPENIRPRYLLCFTNKRSKSSYFLYVVLLCVLVVVFLKSRIFTTR